MLIRRATLREGDVRDVRIEDGRIAAIGELDALGGETVLDARGGALLPGLHDHHLHAAALAASLVSVRCGPPDVVDAEAFAACLEQPGTGWLRATGYHESVAGLLDAAALDRIVPGRPLRVQHRSGRMWYVNSAGLAQLLRRAPPPPGLERQGGRFTGRLFDEDLWLQRALDSEPPCLAQVGALLASFGVTGLTDMSPANGARMAGHFAAEMDTGSLPQHVMLAGSLELTAAHVHGRLTLGPGKLHLHEARLPALHDATAFIRRSHDGGRAVAIHCATEVELVFALAAIAEAGAAPGDRIEHASVTPDWAIAEIGRLGLAVAVQPHFIHERGDRYRADLEAAMWPQLYRLRAFADAGVAVCGGSDAPFGNADPWAAMAAAMSRRTRAGVLIGEAEGLDADQALDLFLRAPECLGKVRRVTPGAAADLCVLDRPWAAARRAPSAAHVQACFIQGRPAFSRCKTAPARMRA